VKPTIIILLVLICALLFIIDVRGSQVHKKDIVVMATKYKKEIDSIKFELDYYQSHELKRKNMERALLLCYNISQYEAHYWSIVYDDFSDKYKTPWELYPAITRIESNFNPLLISDMNAMGMLQTLRATAIGVAKRIGIKYNDTTPYNALLSQIIGFTYLSEIIQKSGIDEGIRSYIEGPDGKNCTTAKNYKKSVAKEREKLRKKIKESEEKTEQCHRELNILTYLYKGVRDSLKMETLK